MPRKPKSEPKLKPKTTTSAAARPVPSELSSSPIGQPNVPAPAAVQTGESPEKPAKPNKPKRSSSRAGGKNRDRVRLTQGELLAIAPKTEKEIAAYIRRLAAEGRPPKAIDPRRVLELRSVSCSVSEIAARMQIGKKTLEKAIKTDPLIRRMFETGDDYGRADLKSACHVKAVLGDTTAIIWAMKNRCGWTDREIGGDRNLTIEVVYADARSANIAYPAPSPNGSHSNGQEVQCAVVRAPVGQDHSGNGQAHPPGDSQAPDSVVLTYVPLPGRRVDGNE